MEHSNIENLIRRCRYMIKYQSSLDYIIDVLLCNGCDSNTAYLIYMAAILLNQKDQDHGM